MTIQSILHPGPPRSWFVTVIAWLGLISGVGATFSGITAIALDRVTLRAVATLAGGALAMVAGAGLNQREEWARQGFIFVQAYGMAGALLAFASGPIGAGSVIILAVGLAINGWIIAKLCSARVRAEFEDDE